MVCKVDEYVFSLWKNAFTNRLARVNGRELALNGRVYEGYQLLNRLNVLRMMPWLLVKKDILINSTTMLVDYASSDSDKEEINVPKLPTIFQPRC